MELIRDEVDCQFPFRRLKRLSLCGMSAMCVSMLRGSVSPAEQSEVDVD